jgi:hypothetical protein
VPADGRAAGDLQTVGQVAAARSRLWVMAARIVQALFAANSPVVSAPGRVAVVDLTAAALVLLHHENHRTK